MLSSPAASPGSQFRTGQNVEAGRGGPRLLIADDDYLVTIALAGSLRDAGFEVVGIASSAEEAIALAESRRPAMILMDIRLAGERDGIDAALQIFRTLGIRCIFTTAYHDALTRARAEIASPLDWLPKPYTAEAAVAIAKRAVSRLERAATP